jgi:hypothetical protein
MEPENQLGNNREHLKPWQFKPGQSGNPGGRPKGTVSLKTYARKYLEGLSEEEKLEFMAGLDKSEVWRMAEGNPATNTDITSGGDKILVMPAELITKNEHKDN